MIVSKAALGVAVIATADKAIPALGNVCVETADGAAVAANGQVVAVVGPVAEAIIAQAPVGVRGGADGFERGEQIVLTADTARAVAKSMPRDTLFGGLTELAAFTKAEAAGVDVETTDGRKRAHAHVNRVAPRWAVAWRQIVRRVLRAPERAHVLLNRRLLENAVEALRAVCPYSGEFEAVELALRDGGALSLRAENARTGQRVVIVFGGNADAPIRELTPWERSLTAGGAARRKAVA